MKSFIHPGTLKQFAFIFLLAPCLCAGAFMGQIPGGQTTLNVTSFGAVGDAQQVWVNTTAGSPVVAFTNTLSAADIGKTVELFGVGQTNIGNNIKNEWVTNQQDLIAIITNVSGNNAYLSGEIPFVTSNGVYCIYGANNVNAFSSCIAAASTNAIIYIPHGTISPWGTTNAYLFVPCDMYTNYDNASGYPIYPSFNSASIPLNRGGLTFEGDGEGQTILMQNGAYKNEESANYPYTGDNKGWCTRGYLFQARPPITNDFPLIFTNLTMDGGLPNGYIGYPYPQPANPIDGLGWDQTHHAMMDGPPGVPGQIPSAYLNSLKIFANCEFRHWRGEMLIGVAGGLGQQPGYILITNCTCWDGNATAFNMNFAHTIADCTFSNMYQDEEFYVAWPTNAPSWFINNYSTNCAHSWVALNGGTSTNEPYYISNNVFVSAGGMAQEGNDGIQTTPCANVFIANNQFICSNACNCIVLNSPGEQGYFNNSNIWITGNSLSALKEAPTFLVTYGGAFGVQDVTVSNNVLTVNSMAPGYRMSGLTEFGSVTNLHYVKNNFSAPSSQVPWYVNVTTFSSGNSGGPYALIETNTAYQYQYNPAVFGIGTTSTLSYANGPWYQTSYTVSNQVIVLKDTDASQIPAGAQMVLDNTTNYGPNNGIYTIYLNSARTRSQMTTNGQINAFNWMPGIGWVSANATQTSVQTSANKTTGPAALPVQFTSATKDSSGQLLKSWHWNFGDGSISTAQNPSHTYTNTGTFYPVLTAANAIGLPATSSGSVIVVTNPAVQFTIARNTGVSRFAAQFQSPLKDSGGNAIKNWRWNFGDGAIGTGENPVHTFTNLGTYYPYLTVTDVLGFSATYYGAAVTVTNPAVKFSASHTNACPLLTTQFTCPATDSGGNRTTNWLWDFGDGTYSTLQNPRHIYNNIQTYNPSLTLSDSIGLSPATFGPAIAVVNPTVQFTVAHSNGVSRLTVAFKTPLVDSVGVSIKSWSWNFGDGTFGAGPTPSHIYTNIGTYVPVLTITNTLGLTATSSGSITVTNPMVKFTANHTNACPFLTIQFSSPAMDSGGNRVTNWLWNFGDGTYSAAENPAHVYTSIQTYNPSLTVANAFGLLPASSGPAIKVSNPAAQFKAARTNGVSRFTVAFTSPAADNVGVAIKGWSWNFGDGTVGTGQNPSHTYTNLGTYYPALTITNILGLYPQTSGPMVTVTNPAIKFTAIITNGTEPLTVQFNAPKIDSGGNTVTNWYWDFGDGAISTAENPSHTYTSVATFYPALAVTNIYGLAPTGSGPVIYVKSTSPGIQIGTPPPLTVTLADGAVALSWPTNAAGYTLQFSTNLIPPVDWMNITSPPVIVGGQNVVTNSVASPQMFFRLNQ